MRVTFDDIVKNERLKAYIRKGNEVLGVLGYTDHSHNHTMRVAETAAGILSGFGRDERTVELTRIAGYMHDIGNMVNRAQHPLTGAVIAFTILTDMGMDAEEIADVVSAVGNHDEGLGEPVSPIAAALIIADKTDVRRSRVRNANNLTFDIHDRVNYAVVGSDLDVDNGAQTITLKLQIDDSICPVIDYFEIFLSRMLMCKRAAEFLGAKFKLIINGAAIL